MVKKTTKKTTGISELLFDAVNPVSYTHLDVYKRQVGDDAQLNMLIKRVREALEPDPRAPRYLITLRAVSYTHLQ